MKKFINKIDHIMQGVLADSGHEGWEDIFEHVVADLADSNDTDFGKLVADVVTDYICEELPDNVVLAHQDIKALYAAYDNYADQFEERVRDHLMSKGIHENLCRVV